jgi:hypothetical protein
MTKGLRPVGALINTSEIMENATAVQSCAGGWGAHVWGLAG